MSGLEKDNFFFTSLHPPHLLRHKILVENCLIKSFHLSFLKTGKSFIMTHEDTAFLFYHVILKDETLVRFPITAVSIFFQNKKIVRVRKGSDFWLNVRSNRISRMILYMSSYRKYSWNGISYMSRFWWQAKLDLSGFWSCNFLWSLLS